MGRGKDGQMGWLEISTSILDHKEAKSSPPFLFFIQKKALFTQTLSSQQPRHLGAHTRPVIGP